MYFNIQQHLDELIEFLAPEPQSEITVQQPIETPEPTEREGIAAQPEPEEQPRRWNDILEDGELAEQLSEVGLTDNAVDDYFDRIAKYSLLSHEEMVELAQQVEAGLYAKHLLTTNFTGSRRQRRDYWRLVEQGANAQEKMLCANLRLVVEVVKGLPIFGNEPAFGFLDLIQEGNMGLYRAIQLWDYSRGFQFSTYAYNWIWQFATRGLADQSRTVRLPANVVQDLLSIRKAANVLMLHGTEPTAQEIALALDKSPEKIIAIQNAEARYVSPFIEVWMDRVPYQLGELIVDAFTKDGGDLAIENMYREELRAAIRFATAEWEQRERDILYSRWGLKGWPIETLDAIGERHDVSRERIRQIEKKLPTRLKEEEAWLERMLDRNAM